jgi:hypothetical protein
LEDQGISVLPFAELENMFLAEPILREVARRLALDDKVVIVATEERVFELLSKHREQVVSRLAGRELEFAFQQFDTRAVGQAAIDAGFRKVFEVVDPTKIFNRWDQVLGQAIAKRDYTGALQYYNNKGLAAAIGHIFKTPIVPFILRLLQTHDGKDLLSAMASLLPKIR